VVVISLLLYFLFARDGERFLLDADTVAIPEIETDAVDVYWLVQKA
jgi:hypothetical protein